MGFVEGDSLADRIKDGPLPSREAAEITRKVSEAIAYAHQRGVIHRDLKPGNILMDSNGEPRVTDFGLAKRVEGDSGLTATGQVLGTPSYMPPEQAARKIDEIDERADVYSLGAILYALLTGRPPFQAETPVKTLIQVIEQDPVSPSRQNLTIPVDLNTVTMKCLQKDPSKRYIRAIALRDDLDNYLVGKPVTARPIGPTETFAKWCVRNPSVAILTLAAGILLVVGIAGISWQWSKAVKARGTAQRATLAATLRGAQAQAALARSYLNETRALRLAQRPGWKWRALQLIHECSLIRLELESSSPPNAIEEIPSIEELRAEAIETLLSRDLRLVQELPNETEDYLSLDGSARAVLGCRGEKVLLIEQNKLRLFATDGSGRAE